VSVTLRALTGGFDGPLVASTAKVKALQTEVAHTGTQSQKHLDGMAASSSRFGASVKALPAIAAGAGAAIGAALGYAVKKAIDFDKEMHNVNSISGLSQKALDGLGKQVIDLSTTLPQSATTLASGLYDVASSGFQGADGMKVLKASAVSASAGLTDTATAAQAITAVLNAYSLDAGQAADVSDQLFQTVNLGVTTFEALAHNVGDYIGQAHALGMSFAQTQSAIATLTLTGTTQAQAGTALGSVLNSLIRPQQGLAQAIKATGYSSGSAAIQALGLRGTLMKLAQQTGGSAEAMGQLFTDSQALRSVLQLTSNGGTKWAEVAAKIEDPTKRAGAAQKALAEQSKSLSYQLEVAKNKLDAAALSVGNKLLPALAQALGTGMRFGPKLIDDLKPLLPALEDLWHAAGNLVQIGGDLVRVFGPVGAEMAKLVALPIVGVFMALAGALQKVTGLLASHEHLVALVAVAYAIHLAGGVNKAAWALTGNLLTALSKAMFGLQGMAAKSGAARTAMLSFAGSAARAGVAAGFIVALTSAWEGYNAGAKEAADLTKKVKDAFSHSGDLEGFKKARDEILGLRDDATAFLKDWGNRSLLSRLISPGDNMKAAALGKNLQQLYDDANKTDVAWQKFYNTVNDVLESGFKNQKQADAFHNTMVLSGKAFSESVPMLEAAGVKVGDTFANIKAKLDIYRNDTKSAATGSKLVTQALQDIATGATDTTTAIDKLQQGLDQLMGVFLDSDKAAIAFEQSLDDMTASFKKNGRSLDENTQKGRDNRSAIIDSVSALEQKMVADAKAGAAAGELSKTLETGRQRLVKQATAAGMSKTAMEKLLTQYHLTPAMVQTVIKAAGVPAAVKAIKTVKAQLDTLKNRTIEIRVKAPVTTGLRTVGDNANYAVGGLVRGPGTSTSDSVPINASNGEFVVNAAAASQHLALLNAINTGAFRPVQYAPPTQQSVMGGGGFTWHGDLYAQAAPGEKAGQTVPRELRALAFTGGLR
jgi:TP901 family phage tail tape measure protein